MKVLVLGGTGVISRAIVDRLLAERHQVTVYNRGTRTIPFAGDVTHIRGDRLQRQQFESDMRQRTFDAVIDMICFNEADARSSVAAFRNNAGHLVICSSIAAYKRPYKTVPTVEAAEEFWDNPVFGYAYHKAEMEKFLRPVIQADRLPITIVRPSLTYGPGASNIGVLRQNYGVMDRIQKGKPLVMFGDGTTSWSWTFAPDLAKGFVGILGNSQTYGESYHICSEELRIWEDLYLEFGKIVGRAPRIVHIPAELLYQAAPNLCAHLYFEKTYTGLFDNAKIRQVIPGYRAQISLNEGLRTIAEWFEKEANTVDPEKDALEDKLVELHRSWTDQITNLYTK
jgi:nucleoside-diphosphate-sugar epimerase